MALWLQYDLMFVLLKLAQCNVKKQQRSDRGVEDKPLRGRGRGQTNAAPPWMTLHLPVCFLLTIDRLGTSPPVFLLCIVQGNTLTSDFDFKHIKTICKCKGVITPEKCVQTQGAF